MAYDQICKRCGWKESPHDIVYLYADHAGVLKAGFKATLADCRGYVSSDPGFERRARTLERKEEEVRQALTYERIRGAQRSMTILAKDGLLPGIYGARGID